MLTVGDNIMMKMTERQIHQDEGRATNSENYEDFVGRKSHNPISNESGAADSSRGPWRSERCTGEAYSVTIPQPQ